MVMTVSRCIIACDFRQLDCDHDGGLATGEQRTGKDLHRHRGGPIQAVSQRGGQREHARPMIEPTSKAVAVGSPNLLANSLPFGGGSTATANARSPRQRSGNGAGRDKGQRTRGSGAKVTSRPVRSLDPADGAEWQCRPPQRGGTLAPSAPAG